MANQINSAIAVLHSSIGHMHSQQVPAAIHQDVALAAIDLLGRVVLARSSRGHHLDRLAVHDPKGRIPRVGLASRPWLSRTNISRA